MFRGSLLFVEGLTHFGSKPIILPIGMAGSHLIKEVLRNYQHLGSNEVRDSVDLCNRCPAYL